VEVGVELGVVVGVGLPAGVGVGEGLAVGVGLGVGVPAGPTTTYLESLGIPLVKMLTKAGPDAKLVTGVELKELSDQPAIGSTGRKAISLLSILRS
jgi:hypothetical protein